MWLCICAWQDWKTGEVSNWLTIPPFLYSFFHIVFFNKEIMIQFAVIFVILIIFYLINAMGGADVKILTTLIGLWPTAFWGALIVQGVWGLVEIIRKGKKTTFKAIPSFAIGAILGWLLFLII